MNTAAIEKTGKTNNISVCGYGPVMVLTEYANLTSENARSEILRRGNSGDIYHTDEVVDYISIIFVA